MTPKTDSIALTLETTCPQPTTHSSSNKQLSLNSPARDKKQGKSPRPFSSSTFKVSLRPGDGQVGCPLTHPPAWHPCLHFVCLCPKPFSLQSVCNHLGFQERQMIMSSWQGTETTPNSRPFFGWTTCLTPDNNLGNSPKTKTVIMTNQTSSVTKLLNYAYLLSPTLSSFVYLNL
jgi:hypothetical protein